MTRLARVLATICVGGLAASVSPAFGAFPGHNGDILFDSDRDGGDLDIWTMSPTGTDLLNATADSDASEGLGNWRADGRKIAFQSDRVTAHNPEGDIEIFVMEPHGSNVTQLTSNELDDENPAWSPDGRKIVFMRDFDPVPGEVDYDLFTMNADGTDQLNITNSTHALEFDPNWSPDGRKIVFGREGPDEPEIYKMNPDGSHVQQLTFNDGVDALPNWSPDGRRIAFTGEREGNFDVYTMRADGSNEIRLTFNPGGDGFPAWSPDGKKIAFTTDRDATAHQPDNWEVYTMRADGSHQVNRTNNPAFDAAPDWQPLP